VVLVDGALEEVVAGAQRLRVLASEHRRRFGP
jgi:hypothetical protein